jgi:hypothetical protein
MGAESEATVNATLATTAAAAAAMSFFDIATLLPAGFGENDRRWLAKRGRLRAAAG